MASQHNTVFEPAAPATRLSVEELMEDILRSVPFRTSRQCQDLFRYIVEHSLAGTDDSLRERVIGMEVFGRAPDYDTADDPVVRVRAADIRKRLAQYYQARKSDPGHWTIDIPTGSYKAQFHPPDAASPHVLVPADITPHLEVLPSSDSLVVDSSAHRRKQRLFWATTVILGCVAILSAVIFLSRDRSAAVSPFDQFWAPVLANPRPVLVCTGSNRVYRLTEEARARYRKNHPHGEDGTANLEVLVPKEDLKSFTGQDFFPIKDTYLTIGDASATAQISSLLTAGHHAFDLRFGSDLSFGDLRESSAVLIGAFNNSWTLNMTDNFQFVFDGGDTAQMHVKDRYDGSRSWWPKFSNGKFSEDYAIISRILNPKTGSVLVTIAGLDHTGTHAAGDFVTNPQMISDFIKQAPKDWNRKNLQIVLRTNIVNDIPGAPTVVATHYW